MAKTIFYDGTPVTPDWLNSVSNPVFDGQDLDGHRPPVSDGELDSSPGSVKARVETIADWLKVEHTSGLGVQWKPGTLRLATGSIISIPANVATLPNNATTQFFVQNGGSTVEHGASFPTDALRLATVVTAGGAVTTITDLRSALFVPFDPIHGSLSAQTQALRDADTALNTRVDSLESSVSSVESSIDFSAANEGDIIRVGSGGGLVADDATNATGLNASFLDGLPAALSDGNIGDAIILGTGNSLIFGAAPADSLGGYALNVSAWQTHETLVRSPSGDIRSAGGLRLEYGSNTTNYVFGDRKYAFDVFGSTTSAVFPRPSRKGEFIEITNLGTSNSLILDFKTNAIGTSIGNGLLGTAATETYVATNTIDTNDWFVFASPNTTGSAATGAGGSGGSGGSSSVVSTWSEVQSAWLAATAITTGGAQRTVTASNLSYSLPTDTTAIIPLDASSLLAWGRLSSSDLVRVPVNGGASTVLASAVTTGTEQNVATILPDGKIVVAYKIFDPANNTVTPIPTGGLPAPAISVFGYQDRIIFHGLVGANYALVDFNRTTQSITSFTLSGTQVMNPLRWGSDNKIWIATNTQIQKYNPASMTLEAATTVPGFSSPRRMIGVAQSGRMIVSGQNGAASNALWSVSQDLSSAVSLLTIGVNSSKPAPLPDGRLIMHSPASNEVIFISADGLAATKQLLSASFAGDRIVASPNGDLLLGGYFSSKLNMGFLGSPSAPLSVLRSPFYSFAHR